MTFKWKTRQRDFKINGEFRISRGTRHYASVLQLTIEMDGFVGQAECVPYSRYGESLESSALEIDDTLALFADLPTREQIVQTMRPGAARNAIDCALWDVEAKISRKRVWEVLSKTSVRPLVSAYTLSADTPDNMHQNAKQHRHYPLLKMKLLGSGDIERIEAVHDGHPTAKIIADANEAWDETVFKTIAPMLSSLGVVVLEQPLPAGSQVELPPVEGVDICADEAITDLSSMDNLPTHFSMINVKLDKVGGLTSALTMIEKAKQRDLRIMLGCMVGSSLAMAPAFVAAQYADYVDLDGPLLLAEDSDAPLHFDRTTLHPPSIHLWG